jgi:hypothetical protein
MNTLGPSIGDISDFGRTYPTKHLTGILGKGHLSLEEWRTDINNHHVTLLSSHVDDLHDNAMRDLDSSPTTIEEDEEIIRNLKNGN